MRLLANVLVILVCCKLENVDQYSAVGTAMHDNYYYRPRPTMTIRTQQDTKLRMNVHGFTDKNITITTLS